MHSKLIFSTEKSSRTPLHYVIQNDGAHDLVLPPWCTTWDCLPMASVCLTCMVNTEWRDHPDLTTLMSGFYKHMYT